MGIIFTGCQQEDDKVYSCNKEINSWVKNNLSAIQKMESNEFLAIDIQRQRGIYNAFSAEQRQSQWILKIKEALKMEWSEAEKEHLKKILSKITLTSSYFDTQLSEDEKDEFKVWTYKWIKYAEESLGWSPKLVQSMIGMPHRLLNKKGELAVAKISLNKKTREETPSCDCEPGSNDCDEVTQAFGCIPGYLDHCKDTNVSCGLWWLSPCTGLCR